ncbi:hypothetical protein C9417_13415 [Rhizobium sp. SEMIA 4088]|nr:hypothetical protein C9417_13415 [Rhizobium sp. SEMIA 4088]
MSSSRFNDMEDKDHKFYRQRRKYPPTSLYGIFFLQSARFAMMSLKTAWAKPQSLFCALLHRKREKMG